MTNIINKSRAAGNEATPSLVYESAFYIGRRVVEQLGIRFAGVEAVTTDAGIVPHRNCSLRRYCRWTSGAGIPPPLPEQGQRGPGGRRGAANSPG